MLERFRRESDAEKARCAKERDNAEEARVAKLTNSILKAMCHKDGIFTVVRVEGSRSDDGGTMMRIGGLLLETGLAVNIGETCEGFNSIGTARDRRIEVVPRGQELPEHWNHIFPTGADREGTKPFKLLDNIPGKEGVLPIVGANIGSLDPIVGLAAQQSTQNS